jgi:hypothetical protein
LTPATAGFVLELGAAPVAGRRGALAAGGAAVRAGGAGRGEAAIPPRRPRS